MEIHADSATTKTVQYEILAEIVYEYPRYLTSYEWGRTKPKHWECHVCGKALDEKFDASGVRSHLWWEHNISPVQSGFTWIGRPVGCIAPTRRKHGVHNKRCYDRI